MKRDGSVNGPLKSPMRATGGTIQAVKTVQNFQGAMFNCISLEERVPPKHLLRTLRAVVDVLLATMGGEFEAVYARRGRPLVPPERLLKALLLQILSSIRSERLLVEVTCPAIFGPVKS